MRVNDTNRKGGLKFLLAIIVAVFVIVAAIVGIKFLVGTKASPDGKGTGKAQDKDAVAVTGIEITMDRQTVRAGEETQLNVVVTPENATNRKLKWTVGGNGGTVTADNRLIPNPETGKSTVTVTAEAADGSGVKASVSVRVLEAIDPLKPMIAVTYDDGPKRETTTHVLDVLEENYAVATFFMQGKYVTGNEDILQRSYGLGNELANHSYDHPQLTTLSEEGIRKQIFDTDELIKKAVPQVENPILRPPYGAFNDTVKAIANKPIIMWKVDTLDWKTRSTEKTIESCMTAKDGDIILMHDIHETTTRGTEAIITGLQEKGFQLVTVSELYHYRNGDFSNGSVHYTMSAEEMLANQAKEEAATATEGSTDAGTEETATTAVTE